MYCHSGPSGGPRSPNSPSASPVVTCSAPTRCPPPGGASPRPGGGDASAGGAPSPATGGGAGALPGGVLPGGLVSPDRKSTRLNSSHVKISYAVCCLKKKKP